MPRRSPPRRLGRVASPPSRAFTGCASPTPSVAAQRARAAELARLDPDALRDLGLTYGEIDSYVAEARGAAARTRLRVYDDPSGWWST
jgi:uncharacterized protein YjiS (DUF1127 family)